MPQRAASPVLALVSAALVAVTLSACGSGMALVTNKTEGYDISPDALLQIRPGQSAQLVLAVLGTPQTQSAFGQETAWYYVETKVSKTAFGARVVNSRTVLAIYFDEKKKVKDKAVYGLQDGKVVAIESRKTPSYGLDRTFIESIIASFQGV
jgi:outer membrane protein assembly factor BamE (lipoprotein component of BamABCDE complex)